MVCPYIDGERRLSIGWWRYGSGKPSALAAKPFKGYEGKYGIQVDDKTVFLRRDQIVDIINTLHEMLIEERNGDWAAEE